jgi:hypothetical protein
LNYSPFIAHCIADALVILHLVFIVFVLIGAFMALKWRTLIWVHIPCLIWGVLVEMLGWYCPLTPIENSFREQAGLATYSGDFVMQYIMPIIYPPELTRSLQIFFGLVVLLLNMVAYGLLIRRWRFKYYTHD